MSTTEVYTLEPVQHRTSSKSINIIRARSPHPPELGTISRTSDKKNGDVELATLTRVENPSHGGSAPPSQHSNSAETKVPWWKPHLQFAACCSSLLLAGWNDGSTGPLLPRIQSHYHVGYAVVSLIFIFNCVGFITAALANVHLTDKFGFGTVMVIGALAQTIGYALEAPAPPFPVFVLGYAINGFGLALQDAGANGFVASLEDHATVKMGILHAVYGLGALCAPLSATQFYKRTHWSFQYLISVGLSLAVAALLGAVFRFQTQEKCLLEAGQAPDPASEHSEGSKYRAIFRLKEVHLLAFFIFVYVGVEVTIGGWTVTYILDVRGGGSSSGYVSSGFFGGLTFGRVALLWVNKKIGERNAIFIYTILAIALELVVWLVPSLVGGAVAVTFIGMLLGPIYPIVMNHSARILPRSLLTGSIGWIAGFGQAGSAFLPFLTGAIASSRGIWSLQPLMVAMMAFMLVMWFIVPGAPRRLD